MEKDKKAQSEAGDEQENTVADDDENEEITPEGGEDGSWLIGIEEELGVKVSAGMAQKLRTDHLALKKKIESMTGLTSARAIDKSEISFHIQDEEEEEQQPEEEIAEIEAGEEEEDEDLEKIQQKKVQAKLSYAM